VHGFQDHGVGAGICQVPRKRVIAPDGPVEMFDLSHVRVVEMGDLDLRLAVQVDLASLVDEKLRVRLSAEPKPQMCLPRRGTAACAPTCAGWAGL
jgi:hypothetical protein